MVNDHLDPLEGDIADLLAAERNAPGIPDMARVRLSRRLDDLPPSSVAISDEVTTAKHANAALRHSTTMVVAAAAIALVVGVGVGLAASGLGGKEQPIVAHHVQPAPDRSASMVTEPEPEPEAESVTPTNPNPSPAATSPYPSAMPTPIATTPQPVPRSKERSALPVANPTASADTPTSSAVPSTPTSTMRTQQAENESTTSAVDDELASAVVPPTVLVAALGKPPGPEEAKAATSGNGERIYLDLARDAVRDGDATTAIALVKAHKKKFGNTRASEERDVLWIEALITEREYDSARDRIETFERRYPRSKYLRDLRKQRASFPPSRSRMSRVRSGWAAPLP